MKQWSVKPLAAALLVAGIGAAALPAGAAEYSLFDLGSLGGSHARTYATGINASGQVAGYGYQHDIWTNGISATGDYQAFVTGTHGQGITALGYLAGDAWSQARGINDAGQVVGTSGVGPLGDPSSTTTAFTASAANPTLHSLGTLGGASSSADAINAGGQVVGTSNDAAGINRAYITATNVGAMTALNTMPVGAEPPGYLAVTGVNGSGQVVGSYGEWSSGRYGFVTGPNGAALHTLPGQQNADGYDGYNPDVRPTAINAEGQTVGAYYDASANAFLKDANGVDLPLDFSSAPHYLPGNTGGFGQYGPNTSTQAYGINSNGQVVGSIVRNDLPGSRYAFITGEDGSNLVEVNSLSFVNQSGPLGFDFTSATGITDAGDFVVNASNGHAYLVSLVPEPASVALLLAGLGVVGVAARRGRKTGQSLSVASA